MKKESIFKPSSVGPRAHWITLFLTTRCNLACDYCYNEGIEQKDLSFEKAKKIVDWFLEQSFEEEKGISFFGGEPLLKFDLMKKIVAYAKSRDPEIKFSITTNGTLISEEHVQFFNKNFKYFVLSLDGPREVHDTHRKFKDGSGSFDSIDFAVLKKIKGLAIAAVVTPKTVHRLYDTLMFQRKLKEEYDLLDYGFRFAYELDWKEEDIEEYRSQLKALADYYVENYKKQGPKFSLPNFDEFLGAIAVGENMPKYYCDAGRAKFAVSPTGELYSCHRFYSGRLHCLGNVLKSVDIAPLEKNNYFITEFEGKCVNCKAKCLCSRCAAVRRYFSKGGNEMPAYICRMTNITHETMQEIIERLKHVPSFRKKFNRERIIGGLTRYTPDHNPRV